jgi:hypothetical protein
MNEHTCLVCGYSDDLDFVPCNYKICGCCGTEFGYDDLALSHEELRQEWIDAGCPWFDEEEPKPAGWDPYVQLLRAKLIEPRRALRASNTVVFSTGLPTAPIRRISAMYGKRPDEVPVVNETVTVGEMELVGAH